MADEGWQSDGSYVPCGKCGWIPQPEPPNMQGKPIYGFQVGHYNACPLVPNLTPEAAEQLRRKLDEFDECRRRGLRDIHRHVIG